MKIHDKNSANYFSYSSESAWHYILFFKDKIPSLEFYFACCKFGSSAVSDMKSLRQKKVLTVLVMD